jgi:membrane associated rhomboid family serine protease
MLLREDPLLDAAVDRSLVLEAMGIAHEVAPTPDGRWALVVDDGDAAAAEAALSAWEAENAAPVAAAPAPEYGRTLTGAVAALLLVAFAGAVRRWPAVPWDALGSADASRIVRGEWWRIATALTLHADAAHVAGNAAALGIFLGALAQRLGPARATWLTLAAGLAGNAGVAAVARSGHVSVGASTAVFGALGALSALEVPRRRAWVTLGVGAALLGLLGTGARADLLAHLFGFLAGVAEGFLVRRLRAPRRSVVQPALALAAAGALALAWLRAVH